MIKLLRCCCKNCKATEIRAISWPAWCRTKNAFRLFKDCTKQIPLHPDIGLQTVSAPRRTCPLNLLCLFTVLFRKLCTISLRPLLRRKEKIYKTPFGIFTYRDVPSAVYPYGITCFTEQGYAIQIASPEKALCDELYIQSPVASQGELKELMFDGLRIDWDAFCKLSVEDVAFLNGKYHCTNIQKLQKIMEKIA